MRYIGHLLSWPMEMDGDGIRVHARHLTFRVGTCRELAKTFLFHTQEFALAWDDVPDGTWQSDETEVLRNEIDATDNPPGLFGISYEQWVAVALGEFLWFHAWQRIPGFDALNRELHASGHKPVPLIAAVKIAPDYQIPEWMKD